MMLIFLAIPRSTDMWTADRTLDVLMQKSVSVIGHLPMAQSELSIVELVVTDASLVVWNFQHFIALATFDVRAHITVFQGTITLLASERKAE
jgi:hypothetical protein